MQVIDLFSGIGGFSVGMERAGHQTVAFCEPDPYCRKVLKKHWPEVSIYDDINSFPNTKDLCRATQRCGPFCVLIGFTAPCWCKGLGLDAANKAMRERIKKNGDR